MFSSIDPCTSPIVQVFSPQIDFALAFTYIHVIQPPIAGDQSAPSVHVQLARQPISVYYRFVCGYALVHILSEIFILHFGLQSLSRLSPPTHRRSFKKGYPLGFYKECMFPKPYLYCTFMVLLINGLGISVDGANPSVPH